MNESVLQVLERELETLLSQIRESQGKIAALQQSIELLRLSYGGPSPDVIEAPKAPAKKRGRKPSPAKSKVADYQTWMSKKEAAETLGVHTKTVEQFVKKGKLRVAKWKRPTGGHQIVLCDPADIWRIREERESVDGSPA